MRTDGWVSMGLLFAGAVAVALAVTGCAADALGSAGDRLGGGGKADDVAADGGEAAADGGGEDPVLLSYHYGNQIVGSMLEIRASGAVVHTERVCCPPTFHDRAAAALDADALAALQADIAAVAAAAVVTSAGDPSCAGCRSGELAVFSGGQELTVRAHTNALDETQTITASTAPEAADLLALVNAIVDQDML